MGSKEGGREKRTCSDVEGIARLPLADYEAALVDALLVHTEDNFLNLALLQVVEEIVAGNRVVNQRPRAAKDHRMHNSLVWCWQ